MARPGSIGNDRIGPVAEWPTRGRCNVLFPGSSPGRASSLRCSAASARQANCGEGCRAVARKSVGGLSPNGLRVAQPRQTGGASVSGVA